MTDRQLAVPVRHSYMMKRKRGPIGPCFVADCLSFSHYSAQSVNLKGVVMRFVHGCRRQSVLVVCATQYYLLLNR